MRPLPVPTPPLLFTGMAASSAFGRGAPALFAGALTGQPAFDEVRRFDVSDRRVRIAATAPGSPDLVDELVRVINEACGQAGMLGRPRADCPLLLAVHGDPARGRVPVSAQLAGQQPAGDQAAGNQAAGNQAAGDQAARDQAAREQPGGEQIAGDRFAREQSAGQQIGGEQIASGQLDGGLGDAGREHAGREHAGPGGFEVAQEVAARCGLGPAPWAYTNACVAGTTAVADAATMVASGDCDRVVVAAGYLVESDQFALFDAGRVLAVDGVLRPFSARRKGLLLGDGVAAVVVESAAAARSRGAGAQGLLAGWGRCGDAYHVCAPRPDGSGLARAIVTALRRGRISGPQVGYVNAHGSGTAQSDVAETRALYRALGPYAAQVPVSSTKSTHGQALEASGLLEMVITVLALRSGLLPVNAGFLEADPDCALNLVLDHAARTSARYALTLNMAFGGANTALLVGTP